jgi:hypothetical protein
VSERKLAAHLGVARRKVRLASTDDALLHSGYAVGTVPPFGEGVRAPAAGQPPPPPRAAPLGSSALVRTVS